MKKSRVFKKVSLVALSAVMVGGIALTAAACGGGGGGGGGDVTTISVNIFCNASDAHTNRTICEKWSEAYSKQIGQEVKVNLQTNPDKDAYFEDLKKLWSTPTSVADVIYLSPKYVQSYANAGYVMDLSEYINADAAKQIEGIWSNAIDYYGYSTSAANYTPGQQIVYKSDGSAGAGFYTANGATKVGIYGLPKDYSNFSMGYNKKYFSDELKLAYQQTKGSTPRNVASASKIAGTGSYAAKYEGYSATNKNNYVATYAADGEYTLSDGVTKMTAKAGEEAPLIAIGVPVTYKPFNFYRYNDYESAVKAGDPMANAVESLTFGQGYTVTIPGFPGDYKKITNEANAMPSDPDSVPYDASLVHNVLTYAEYGALVWAVTYYLNTFDWDSTDPTGLTTEGATGGLVMNGVKQVIYGSEQYEGAQGNALYLLPWAASNDADLINTASALCSNPTAKADLESTASALAGTTAEARDKLNLDGSTRTAQVQYGFNSANFIETYAAYEEFGSTWNGNSGNAGDEATAKQNVSGWNYFCMGAAVFYGAGTWDAATRNDTEMSVFEFGQMPSPVAEKYALYSEVKDADFNLKEYSNDPAVKKGSGNDANNDGKQRSNPSDGRNHVYTEQEIMDNQIKRQDKWAARMDSVGYAANGRLGRLSADSAENWKKAATASLIQALTIGETEQVTLTYAGAQLPNYREQCTEFLRYQQEGYRDGSFKDMLTPEGFATTAPEDGRKVWDHYYEIAKAMARDSLTGSSKRTYTVKKWIEECGFTDYGSSDPVRYDTQYDDVLLSAFTGENNTNISFAMKVLRMVCFTYAERDMNIRMQYGLNSVRDSSMYTEDSTWIAALNASSQATMLAYINQRTLTANELSGMTTGAMIARTMGERAKLGNTGFWTPAVYCINTAGTAQRALDNNKK